MGCNRVLVFLDAPQVKRQRYCRQIKDQLDSIEKTVEGVIEFCPPEPNDPPEESGIYFLLKGRHHFDPAQTVAEVVAKAASALREYARECLGAAERLEGGDA